MKKNLNILASIIILLTGCSTIKFVNVEPYTRIITVADKDKDELYILAHCWLVETFVSAEAVIQFQDKEAGKIMGKYTLTLERILHGYYLLGTPTSREIKCRISIDCKDKAVKITFKSSSDNLNKTESEDLSLEWIQLADELETYLNTQTIKW